MSPSTKALIPHIIVICLIGPALTMNGLFLRHLTYWLILVPFAILWGILHEAYESQLKRSAYDAQKKLDAGR